MYAILILKFCTVPWSVIYDLFPEKGADPKQNNAILDYSIGLKQAYHKNQVRGAHWPNG